MLRLLILIVSLAFVSCGLPYVGNTNTVRGPQFSSYSVQRDIVYTPPGWPASISAPAVLLIHGGGWTGGDGRWEMVPIAKQLAKRGYVVFNVTYRMAPRWLYPAPVDDLREAVKWMRAHAQEEGIDPSRIATFGYSAGGHLAALVGLDEQMKINAIVAGGTPADLSLFPGGTLVPQFLGGTRKQIPERFREASPVNHVTRNSPPVFIYHGSADTLVPPEQAWAFDARLTKFKVPHELYWIEGRNHIPAFLLSGNTIQLAIDFLDRNLSVRTAQ
jgi:acetyl esterase/lipase